MMMIQRGICSVFGFTFFPTNGVKGIFQFDVLIDKKLKIEYFKSYLWFGFKIYYVDRHLLNKNFQEYS
jgi:hypothetical protein